jgi:SAM-dependent methyltransferase
MSTTIDWTDVAASWDRNRDHVEAMKHDVTDVLLARLALRPGERVLELGSGTGVLARRLAAAVAPGGHVLASDEAPGMVELIRATLADEPGVEVRRIDAEHLDLPAGSFDAVAIRMGLMLLTSPDDALAACRKVLVPGGRLGVAVWAGPEHNPWLTAAGMAAMVHGVVSGPLPTAPGGPFSLGDPVDLEQRVRQAGFAEVTVTEVDASATFASTDEHFAIVTTLAPPLAAALAAASDHDREAVRHTAAELLASYVTDAGLVVPGRALVCLAS